MKWLSVICAVVLASPVSAQIVIGPQPLVITTTSVPNATVGVSYSVQLTSSNGVGTVTWSSSGSLPPGLGVGSSGILSGTPTQSGTFNFTVNAVDSRPSSASQPLTMTVQAPAPPPLAITTTSVPNATAGVSYSLQLSSSNGVGTVTWSSSGSLPPGLGVGSSGILSGTPTQSGTFNFTVNAVDSRPSSASQPLTMTVQAPASGLAITTTSVPNATVGVLYSQQLTSTGGAGTVTWSASGSLPPGLSLGSSGVIGGTPTQSGTYGFQVTATDARQNTASKPLSLTVQVPLPALAITTSSLPGGTIGTAYSAGVNANGGVGAYGWSLSGSLPPGLSFASTASAGQISGTPTTAGTYSFTVSVHDSQEHSDSKQFSITISSTAPPATTLTISSPSTLPNGAGSALYNFGLEATGGVRPYTWSLAGSGLPPGLTVDPSGAITGTPTTAGQYSFSVQVTDSGQGAAAQSASQGFSLRIAAAVSVTTVSPIKATAGTNLVIVMTATGGMPLYLWSLAPGSQLPTGFTLETSSGFFSGTPAEAGTFTFTVQVNDNVQNTATKVMTLVVQPALSITTASTTPTAGTGVNYSLPLAATGGNAPFTWALDSGTLPPGVTLNPSTGVLSGMPLAAGTYAFVLRVTDSVRATTTKSFSLPVAVSPPVVISANSLDFTGLAGGDAPAPQSLALNTPAAQALAFTLAADGGAGVPAPAWLLLRLLKGSTPARIPVAVDPTGLAAGQYSARIIVTTGDGRQTIVAVSLTLTDAPPQLEVSPGYLRFAGSASALAASEQALLVRNAGGGGALPFTATVSAGGSWLSVLPDAGQTAPNAPVSLRVLVNAQGLSLGARRGVVHVESAAGIADIPVSLLVRDEGAVIGFNLTGVRFETRDGAGSTRSRSANILNLGTGTVNWEASIVSGAEWLTLGATSGSATPAAPGALPLSVNPGTLKSGNYYASIKITDPGSLNSPQFLSAMLAVVDAASPADPDPTPSGLFFVGKTGGAAPAAQAVRIFTSSTTPVPFQISANTSDGGNWLSVSPAAGSASTANPGQVNVTVTPGALTPGVYTGDVTVAFSSTSIRTVNLTLVVQPATVVTASAKTRSVAGCTPAKMALAQTGLVNSFVAPAGWPTPMVVRLADDCGDPVLNAQIVLTYSNGDPAQAMSLTDPQNGVYSATWVPAKTGASVSVTARATASRLAQLTALLTGTVAPNKVPFLLDNSTLNSFNAVKGAALAPGTVATIRGSGLAATAASADVLPLPTSVNGTRVLVGGVEAPLYAVSDDQIQAQIPVELAANRQYQVLVSANGALTLPDTITLAAAQPGLQISEDGTQVVAQHSDTSPINPSSPATRGEEIILYLVGMGQTDPPVPSGVAAPGDALAKALAQPTVTIGGQPAEVLFAGLTPGSVGLYQIRLRVPPDAQPGALNVQVTQGDAQSNPGVLPVQ